MKARIVTPLLVLCATILVCAPSGVAATTTTPSITWGRALSLERPGRAGSLDAVSCAINTAGKQLCLIADETGNVWWSKTPWKGSGAWRRITVDKVRDASLTGVSCPTTTFCAVVDNQGYVIRSHNPSGGAKAWSRPIHVDTTAAPGGGFSGFSGISCPAANLCVAVDNAGQVVTTTNPTGGAKAWTVAALPGTPILTSVSCPSTSLCMLAGSKRFYSADPLGGASAWHRVGSAGGVLASLACPSTTACVAVGYGNASTGLASATATPAGRARAWVNTTINSQVPSGNGQLLDSVSCPGVGFCIAIDGADNAFASISPLHGSWSVIKAVRPRATGSWSAISCDYKNCLVVDSRGFLTAGTVKGVAAPGTTTPTTVATTGGASGTTKGTTGTTKGTTGATTGTAGTGTSTMHRAPGARRSGTVA